LSTTGQALYGMKTFGFPKLSALLAIKLPAFAKVTMIGVAMFSFASLAGLPVHDFWFDFFLLTALGSVVGGEPPPDHGLPFRKFLYLWFYRSTHLFVSALPQPNSLHKKWDQTKPDREDER
jgi:hypothetical protein